MKTKARIVSRFVENQCRLLDYHTHLKQLPWRQYKSERKKRGSVTYNTDRENEIRKVFIISLGGGGTSLGSKRWVRERPLMIDARQMLYVGTIYCFPQKAT